MQGLTHIQVLVHIGSALKMPGEYKGLSMTQKFSFLMFLGLVCSLFLFSFSFSCSFVSFVTGSYYVAEIVLQKQTFLTLPTEYQDYGHVSYLSPSLRYFLKGKENRSKEASFVVAVMLLLLF